MPSKIYIRRNICDASSIGWCRATSPKREDVRFAEHGNLEYEKDGRDGNRNENDTGSNGNITHTSEIKFLYYRAISECWCIVVVVMIMRGFGTWELMVEKEVAFNMPQLLSTQDSDMLCDGRRGIYIACSHVHRLRRGRFLSRWSCLGGASQLYHATWPSISRD